MVAHRYPFGANPDVCLYAVPPRLLPLTPVLTDLGASPRATYESSPVSLTLILLGPLCQAQLPWWNRFPPDGEVGEAPDGRRAFPAQQHGQRSGVRRCVQQASARADLDEFEIGVQTDSVSAALRVGKRDDVACATYTYGHVGQESDRYNFVSFLVSQLCSWDRSPTSLSLKENGVWPFTS